MADLRDLSEITLVSVGGGEDLENCQAEANRLGVADRVTFLGQIPRADVEGEYTRADAFCFPSFREPMGGVLFEAMAHGLPIITAARGGPDAIIDDTCGIRVPVSTPDCFAHSIAGAVRRLALDPLLRLEMGRNARTRLLSFGSWEDRADDVMAAYRHILEARGVSLA
jgi:glycosyltransferase involved in cell wall biosynthesis